MELEEGMVWEEERLQQDIMPHRPVFKVDIFPGELLSVAWKANIIPGDIQLPTGHWQPELLCSVSVVRDVVKNLFFGVHNDKASCENLKINTFRYFILW